MFRKLCVLEKYLNQLCAVQNECRASGQHRVCPGHATETRGEVEAWNWPQVHHVRLCLSARHAGPSHHRRAVWSTRYSGSVPTAVPIPLLCGRQVRFTVSLFTEEFWIRVVLLLNYKVKILFLDIIREQSLKMHIKAWNVAKSYFFYDWAK